MRDFKRQDYQGLVTQFQKKEKINLGVIVHEKAAEKTTAMLIFLNPICSDDPIHTLYYVFLKCAKQNDMVLLPIYFN